MLRRSSSNHAAEESNGILDGVTTAETSEQNIAIETTTLDASEKAVTTEASEVPSDTTASQTILGGENGQTRNEKTLGDQTGSNEGSAASTESAAVDGPLAPAEGEADSSLDAQPESEGGDVSSDEGSKKSAGELDSTSDEGTTFDPTKELNQTTSHTGSGTETSVETADATSPLTGTSASTGVAERLAENTASPNDSPAPEGDVAGPDRARFIRRVTGAFEAAGRRDGPIRVQLTPPELGTLRLEIKVERGEIVARLETETHEARNVLLDNLPALRQRLEQQEIKVQRFDVEYNAGSEGFGPQTEDRSGHQGERRGNPTPHSSPSTETEEATGPRQAVEAASDGRLNLFA